MLNTQNGIDWNLLLDRIQDRKCTPFLGAGACFGVLPLGYEIAEECAKDYDYPLEDCHNLARVTQFVAVKRDSMYPKEWVLKRFFKGVGPPDFTKRDEPHGVLADLPLPVYMTTNYDDFMVRALRGRNRDPKRELCRWNKYLRDKPSIFEEESGFEPTVANPVVFHLHGHNEVAESLVLTEDDYLDFLVNISKDQNLIPPRIQRAFTGTSLLFLGYSLFDWDFRVIFRSLVSYLERSVSRAHVSVQLVPLKDTAPAAQKKQAQDYLNDYFGELKVQVYWGTCREFAAELRRRWEALNHGK
jgi:hypothetical protein